MLKLLADMITPAPLYAANANPVVNMDKGCCICLQYLYLINLYCFVDRVDNAFDTQGVISVTSNIIPGLFSQMMHKRNAELNSNLQELMAWLFCEPNPVPLNTAMAMCGLIKPVFRLPYVPLNREKREQGAKLLQQVQEHIPGCKDIQVLNDDDFSIVSKY
jgi:hypothetical protein